MIHWFWSKILTLKCRIYKFDPECAICLRGVVNRVLCYVTSDHSQPCSCYSTNFPWPESDFGESGVGSICPNTHRRDVGFHGVWSWEKRHKCWMERCQTGVIEKAPLSSTYLPGAGDPVVLGQRRFCQRACKRGASISSGNSLARHVAFTVKFFLPSYCSKCPCLAQCQ